MSSESASDAYAREWAARGFPLHPSPARNGVCRHGCDTQDHATYAACLKAAAIQIGNLK